MRLYYSEIELPEGLAFAVATDKGIARLVLGAFPFEEQVERIEAEYGVRAVESGRPFGTLRRELKSYFKGEPVYFFTTLDVDGTAFQRRVWSESRKIPYGNVRSYKWLAAMAGNTAAARAVGNALNRNRVPIIIPCHRVVESSGGLGGFGCGLEMKRRLLELEGVLPRGSVAADLP